LGISLLLLLTVVLIDHGTWINHYGRDIATATAATHAGIFVQRSPNQQGYNDDMQNDRNNNGAFELIVLFSCSCLYQNRFPKTGLLKTRFPVLPVILLTSQRMPGFK